jgi:hypothetical protein
MRTVIFILCACASLGLGTARAQILEEIWFKPTDPLAQRDEYGLLHQSKPIYPSDLAPRYYVRPLYYLEGHNDLVRKPAYIGAVQAALQRLGYYCGPIDGIYTDEVSTAIAHLQKNSSMRVTGTLTMAVRRALHMP